MVDTTKTTEYVNALNAKYENKVANKKTDITGDYTGDTVSYPTVQAVKTYMTIVLSSYVTQTALNNLLTDYVEITDIVNDLVSTDTDKPLSANQGKILKGLVDAKVNISDIKNDLISTDTDKPLSANQGVVLKTLIDEMEINVIKQGTAETGYASTYYITQNGVQVGAKINIEKDKMLRSISIETVGATPTQEETDAGMTTGDKYFLFIVNTVDGDGTTRLILPITEVFDLQTADEVTLTLSSNGVFSIKAGGVTTNYIADGAVTSAKIDSTVRNSWLTSSDVEDIIDDYLDDIIARL